MREREEREEQRKSEKYIYKERGIEIGIERERDRERDRGRERKGERERERQRRKSNRREIQIFFYGKLIGHSGKLWRKGNIGHLIFCKGSESGVFHFVDSNFQIIFIF